MRIARTQSLVVIFREKKPRGERDVVRAGT